MKRANTSHEISAELVPLKNCVEKSVIKINQPEFMIGRAKNASHIVKDLTISRNHCVIRFVDDEWSICDQSSQGTFVNGERLKKDVPRVLTSGDTILLGSNKPFIYTFSIVEESPDTSLKKICVDSIQTCETAGTQSVLSHKQKQLQLKIEQAQQETCVMEIEHSQLEANLHNRMEIIEKRYETDKANLMRRSVNHSDQQKFQEEKSALERQFKEEKDELARSMNNQMEELQKKISEKQKVELRLTEENQQLQEELEKERSLFKLRLEKEEEQVQFERKKVQELEQKHQEAIASMEEDFTIAGMLQKQEMAEKKQAYEEERNSIQTALMEKEKALEVTEKKLQEEGEVRNKFQDVLESELQCSICNELFVCAVTLNCSHTFCQLCITQWKERKKDCPVCRAKITSESRMFMLDGFIDKAVENLSEEMKERRKEIVEEKRQASLVYQQKPKASSSTGAARSQRQTARGRRATARATAETTPAADNALDPGSIYISSEEDDFNDSEVLSLSDSGSDSSSSMEGVPGEYYGGYGYCYRCGRRGHWARGCPNF